MSTTLTTLIDDQETRVVPGWAIAVIIITIFIVIAIIVFVLVKYSRRKSALKAKTKARDVNLVNMKRELDRLKKKQI